jgi:glycine cleavage system transcriptional repressor
MEKTRLQYLVISALGSDRPGIVRDITRPVTDQRGNIVDSRMTILGGEFAILMLVEGSWDTIAKIEAMLPNLESRLDLAITSKRTTLRSEQPPALTYQATVIAIDHPGIVHHLAAFFSQHGINIQSLHTDSQPAPHTGTPTFSAHLVITVPATQHIGQLREEFFELCDTLNLDGILEPYKG